MVRMCSTREGGLQAYPCRISLAGIPSRGALSHRTRSLASAQPRMAMAPSISWFESQPPLGFSLLPLGRRDVPRDLVGTAE